MSDAVDIRPLDVPRDGIPELTHEDIDDAVRALAAGHGPFSIDTERAMGIRYSPRAYLVQIRREGAGTFLIDPIGIEDRLGALADLLATDEWILHAADQDLPSLRELGLIPPEIFDTEVAGILLGLDRVSLQAEVAEILGYGLAKEHSMSDWSARPLAPELRAYAALDVELLFDLRSQLTKMLRAAGRLEWLHEECEEIRLREPKPPRPQPWRKAARQVGLKDRRSLAMLASLWDARDDLAKERDVAPEKVLPSKVLAELAARKPRSRADVQHSKLVQSRARRGDVDTWWEAISSAWSLPSDHLPERRFRQDDSPYPAVRSWERVNPEAAARWSIVRTAVLARADDLGIRQELLLRPALQRALAWEGWEHADEIPILLAALGARPWQVDNVGRHIALAARRAG
ncbi:MAG: HRDC domain-containing protein [Actinomycetaceae bacterium]|nr:HRDC domain-containing protein [Actinomycetaceae bacterium]